MMIKAMFVGLIVCTAVMQSFAQFPDDALRFATPGLGVGARALGMGGAYTGVANDYSALYWNPAGLAQLEHTEFSLGLSHLNFKDNSNYFGKSNPLSNNSTTLNGLGLVFPVPVSRGSLVVAFGYNRESNFTTGISYDRLSPFSIAQEYAQDGAIAPKDNRGALLYNLAYEAYLADTLRGRWFSPLKNNLTQFEKTFEGGGINNWTIGGAVDLAKNVSAGVSIVYQSGTYKFDRNYTEKDERNFYRNDTLEISPLNFHSFAIDDFVESDLSGFSAKFGLMVRQPDRFRIGIAAKTPTVYRVKEKFGTTYTTTPDYGTVATIKADPQSGEYDVATPWVLSGGASIILRDLVLSGDVEYTDWTQLEFRNANADVLALNRKFKEIFRATAKLRAGAEYDIKGQGVRIRGGFIYNTSPYVIDTESAFDQKYITGGLGFLLSESTMLDLTYAYGWWKTTRNDYRGFSQVTEDVKTNNFNLTFSYRY